MASLVKTTLPGWGSASATYWFTLPFDVELAKDGAAPRLVEAEHA